MSSRKSSRLKLTRQTHFYLLAKTTYAIIHLKYNYLYIFVDLVNNNMYFAKCYLYYRN